MWEFNESSRAWLKVIDACGNQHVFSVDELAHIFNEPKSIQPGFQTDVSKHTIIRLVNGDEIVTHDETDVETLFDLITKRAKKTAIPPY